VEFVGKDVEEDGEVQLAWSFSNHSVDGSVCDSDSERFVSCLQVGLVDESVTVSVDHAEGLFELLDLKYEMNHKK